MAGDAGPVTRAVLEIVRGDADGPELASRICGAYLAAATVDGVAMSLLTGTVHRETLSATDAVAARIEDLQFTLGEGVCMDAAATGAPVLVTDIQDRVHTARWPMFAAAVAEQTAVRALFALPLQLGTINVGVLDLYRDTPGTLRMTELRDMVAATDAATLLMLDARVRPDGERPPVARGTNGRGETLWIDRAEVHQATGMILVQLDVTAEDAFVRLRAYAFAQRRLLGDVARDVVTRRLVFSEDME